MSKEFLRILENKSWKITVKQDEGDNFIKHVTLGFAGNDSYSVKVNGRTVASATSKKEAIQRAADLAKK